ncbi:hypothetical protein Sjap_018563 [Stephania japonica]|uniref:Uncharacterized protein n=1 Tax=Stephania japonica TaxID=461633 RepID=A0AAP0I893_9MAGN
MRAFSTFYLKIGWAYLMTGSPLSLDKHVYECLCKPAAYLTLQPNNGLNSKPRLR